MASTENKEKLQALKMTLDRIEKTYGKGTIMRMGDSAIEAASNSLRLFNARFGFGHWWLSQRSGGGDLRS